MELLNKKDFYNNLFDCYKELLTEKQKEYFQSYYFDDLSLSEIADNYNVSRSAIYDQLKKIYIILEQYEEKLGLLDKENKRNEIYEDYLDLDNHEILELIERLRNVE
ncbi:MAG: sigma factor-like helix-turn-helix DNA-binding protein [Bacilli bacterium]